MGISLCSSSSPPFPPSPLGPDAQELGKNDPTFDQSVNNLVVWSVKGACCAGMVAWMWPWSVGTGVMLLWVMAIDWLNGICGNKQCVWPGLALATLMGGDERGWGRRVGAC